MNVLADKIKQANLTGRIFNERQLDEILGGGDASRYGLVNRALKDGSLVRLKRGTYLIGNRHRHEGIHPFAVAQAFLPGSYISFETALAYHGWIPEAVYTTASTTPHRKTIVQDTPSFGQYIYHPLAIHNYQFLASVSREKFGELTAFIAEPLRALMDLVALRKESWTGLHWLTASMRIDEEQLSSIRRRDFSALKSVYKHKAANEFLHSLETTLLPSKVACLGRPQHD
jgi:hypothetical protein